MNKTTAVSVVIAAAGMSSRMQGINKQFLLLDGIPVLARTLSAFDSINEINEIIIVVQESEILVVSDLVKDFNIKKVKAIVPGGSTRQESVLNGLKHVISQKVLIHDGARPFISKEEILNVISALDSYDAAAVGVNAKDTIKRVNNDVITETLDRNNLVQIQTPQGFKTDVILSAHNKAKSECIEVTDDCALAEFCGIDVKVIYGNYNNIKITTPEDIAIARGILGGLS